MEGEIKFRIVVLNPLPNVSVGVQRGQDEVLLPIDADEERAIFEFPLRVAQRHDGASTVRGPEAQGGTADRFIYVNWGVRAGDKSSRWDRRAKVSLRSLTSHDLQQAVEHSTYILEATIDGLDSDGGPASATVPLVGGGWRLVVPES